MGVLLLLVCRIVSSFDGEVAGGNTFRHTNSRDSLFYSEVLGVSHPSDFVLVFNQIQGLVLVGLGVTVLDGLRVRFRAHEF